MNVVNHYEDIKRIDDDFLTNSDTLDLIDVYKKCSSLTSNCENNTTSSKSSFQRESQLRETTTQPGITIISQTKMSQLAKHSLERITPRIHRYIKYLQKFTDNT